jgi:hypothetical protein
MPRTRWPLARIAEMSMLLGMGWSPERIARHPLIESTPDTVRRYIEKVNPIKESENKLNQRVAQSIPYCASNSALSLSEACVARAHAV